MRIDSYFAYAVISLIATILALGLILQNALWDMKNLNYGSSPLVHHTSSDSYDTEFVVDQVSDEILSARDAQYGSLSYTLGGNLNETISLSGLEVLSNEVLVGFEADASNEEIDSVVSTVNGEVVGYLPEISVFVLRVDAVDEASLLTVMETIQGLAGVQYVEPNAVVSLNEEISVTE